MARALHPMALRVARAYRTVARGAALALAGLPPLVLIAEEHAKAYKAVRDARSRGVEVTGAGRKRLMLRLRNLTLDRWKEFLLRESSGRRTVDALQPIIKEWVNRGHGGVSYRLTQILTGHGCFGKYLFGIGKEGTTKCHHCECAVDTAQHILIECSAWEEERIALRDIAGADLSLPTIVGKMVETEDVWRNMVAFCEATMRAKEEAERVRRGVSLGGSARARR